MTPEKWVIDSTGRILVDKFLANVVMPDGDGCWEWSGRKTVARSDRGTGGYGIYGGRVAHRFAYRIFIGDIPDGMQLDHLCMNTGCVNPAHLEPVTPAENSRRYAETRTHCKQGHEFTEENTYMYRRPERKTAHRICRTCANALQRDRYRRRMGSRWAS